MSSGKSERCIMPDNPPYWRSLEAVKAERERYHRHEVFYGMNRQHSIEDGMVIYLRPDQHNMSGQGIHFNKDYDMYAKREAQKVWEKEIGTREEFMARYGKSYL